MTGNLQSLVKTPSSLNDKLINQIAKYIKANLKLKKNWEFSVLIVNQTYIKKLNRIYRGKNKATDVLSFSQREGEALILPKQKKQYLGDIIICLPLVKKQAKIFNHSLEYEFSLLVIHGLLHLLGYEDKTKKQYQIMANIQNKVLKNIYG